MREIEVQNQIHPRNIIALFVIGIVGAVNGVRDFGIYHTPLSKILFPDPVVYNNIINLNQTVMSSMTVQNSIGSGFSLLALGIFILAATFIISLTAGVMGKCD
jgi:hypothetical protein